MNQMIVLLLARVLSLFSLPGIAFAGFEEGEAAYDEGDFPTALREFRALAAQGKASAQPSLGRMYRIGKGVAQDYVEAVKWHKLAAAQGHADAQCAVACTMGSRSGEPARSQAVLLATIALIAAA